MPPEAARVPTVGGFGTPQLEPLLAVRPTHVLESVLADPEVARRLQALSIPVVHVPCSTLQDVPAALVQLGELTGFRDKARQLAAQLQGGLAAARDESAARTARPKVALLLAPDAPITAGRRAFISELLALAGGDNVGDASETDYYHFSLEWLLVQDPDLIICLFETAVREPASLFSDQTGWRSLRAVRQRRVYTVSDLSAVSRPGPRLLEGLEQLKKVLRLDADRDD
jgi:iron complex transport system substrate-binding protein